MFDGKKIREKRERLGISARDLAKEWDVDIQSFWKWEKGTTPRHKKHRDMIDNWLNGTEEVVKSNGTANVDYKEKYYALLEKYTLLLEKIK